MFAMHLIKFYTKSPAVSTAGLFFLVS